MVLFRRGVHFGSYGRVDDGPPVFARLADSVQAAEAAEITKTVFVFATEDLAGFEAGARGYAAAGGDGVFVVGPDDPSRIPRIGQVLGDVFPG